MGQCKIIFLLTPSIIRSDDEEWLIETKGCLEIEIYINQKTYRFNFYDHTRLNQQLLDTLAHSQCFFDENLVILNVVNRANIINFLESVVDTKYMDSFKAQG